MANRTCVCCSIEGTEVSLLCTFRVLLRDPLDVELIGPLGEPLAADRRTGSNFKSSVLGCTIFDSVNDVVVVPFRSKRKKSENAPERGRISLVAQSEL